MCIVIRSCSHLTLSFLPGCVRMLEQQNNQQADDSERGWYD